ncbi:DUF5325 family protein [Brevibacillus dissolubilis]|uniref:DUF5325 family protein n=1 Tax=Brevibacillus dissolubilis TaxID=1844116 RepID=UPI00159B9759|nr:DUF5325 family protein [Brevibacillus dissolubilis]
MNRHQLVLLAIAFLVAMSIAGIGVAIGLGSWLIGILCALLTTGLMGAGFVYRKKNLN